jgi:hypothetical protein
MPGQTPPGTIAGGLVTVPAALTPAKRPAPCPQLGNESTWDRYPSPSALAVLMKKSIFCLSTTGRVFERFHNQVKWVYVRHENPSSLPLVSLTAVRNRGTYFASDSAGRVFQRLRVENGLGWMDVTSPGDQIYLSGVPSNEGNIFFISSDGRLLERQFERNHQSATVSGGAMWTDHGTPARAVGVVAIVDAHTLSYVPDLVPDRRRGGGGGGGGG